jgi:hypothetical protein
MAAAAGSRLTAALLLASLVVALPAAAAAQATRGTRPPTPARPPASGRTLPVDTAAAGPPAPRNVATDSARAASRTGVGGDSAAAATAAAPPNARGDSGRKDSAAAKPDSAAAPQVDCEALARKLAGRPDSPVDQAPTVVLWSAPASPPADIDQGSIDASFVLDEYGTPELATLALTRTKDAAYRQRVADALSRMSFRPARLKGCAVPARAYVSFPTR